MPTYTEVKGALKLNHEKKLSGIRPADFGTHIRTIRSAAKLLHQAVYEDLAHVRFSRHGGTRYFATDKLMAENLPTT